MSEPFSARCVNICSEQTTPSNHRRSTSSIRHGQQTIQTEANNHLNATSEGRASLTFPCTLGEALGVLRSP